MGVSSKLILVSVMAVLLYLYLFQGSKITEIKDSNTIRPNQISQEDEDAIDFRNTLRIDDDSNVFIVSNSTKLFLVQDIQQRSLYRRNASFADKTNTSCYIVKVNNLFVDSIGNVCNTNQINFELGSNCCDSQLSISGDRVELSKAFKDTQDDLLICFQVYMDCVQYCIKNNLLDHQLLFFKEVDKATAQRRMNYCIVECKNKYVLAGLQPITGASRGISNCLIDYMYMHYLHTQGKFELALSSKKIDCHAACLARGSFCSEEGQFVIKSCSFLRKHFKGHICTEETALTSSNQDIEINSQTIRIFRGDIANSNGYCDQTDPSQLENQPILKVCTCIKQYK